MFMLNQCFAQEGHLKTCEVLLSFGATASQQVKWAMFGDVWSQSLAPWTASLCNDVKATQMANSHCILRK